MKRSIRITILLLFIYSFSLSAQDRIIADQSEIMGWSRAKLNLLDSYLDSLGSAAFILNTNGQTLVSRGDTTTNFRAHSMRKSFLSALWGIYLSNGVLDTSKTLLELEIDDTPPLSPSEKEARVIDLLRSRSGVYHTAASETKSMRQERPKRGTHPAGTFWYYNNWDFNVLGTIFEKFTEVGIFEAFDQHFGKVLQLQDFKLDNCRYQLESVSDHRSYKFRISARDLVRFGQLFLQQGKWKKQQIIDSSWIAESTKSHSLTGEKGSKSAFGLMWWMVGNVDTNKRRGLPLDLFLASGSGGQRLIIIPSLDTVIVHLMNTDDKLGTRIGTSSVDRLLNKILAAPN